MAFVPVCRVVIVAVAGALLLGVGIAVSPIVQAILHSQIEQILPLTNGSDTFATWTNPCKNASMYLQFWLFDVVNSVEVVSDGAKPSLRQIGPYTYRECKVKKVQGISTADDTVAYREVSTLVFAPELSSGSESDRLTTANLPVYGIEYLLKKLKVGEELLDILLKGIGDSQLFVSLNVSDLLWGYEDPFLADVTKLLNDSRVAAIIKTLGIQLPKISSRFGLYYGMNNSDDGLYKIYAGHNDVSRFTTVDTWNGSRSLSYWKSRYCNRINGTDGAQFPPFLDKDTVLYLFSTQVCRSLGFHYDSDVSLQGISLYQFKPPSSLFTYPPANPDNECYCVEGATEDQCPESGVLSLSSCQSGAPIFLSQPHFLHGADDYINGVEGLSPNEAEHDSFVSVEPNTGVVLEGAKRLQLNIKLTNLSGISEAQMLPPSLMLPLVWLNESAVANQATLDSFKSQFTIYLTVANIGQYVLIGIGALMLLCISGYVVKKYADLRKDNYSEMGDH